MVIKTAIVYQPRVQPPQETHARISIPPYQRENNPGIYVINCGLGRPNLRQLHCLLRCVQIWSFLGLQSRVFINVLSVITSAKCSGGTRVPTCQPEKHFRMPRKPSPPKSEIYCFFHDKRTWADASDLHGKYRARKVS